MEKRGFLSFGVILGTALAVLSPLCAEPLRVAFGSCAYQGRAQPIWEYVLESNPDIWIWAGDNVYADTEDPGEFREAYAQLEAQPGYAALKATGLPILGTWDDHDFGVNDGGREYPQKALAQQFFLDFLGVPEDSLRRQREGIYHSERIRHESGKIVQVILLDTRTHRSPLTRYPADEGWNRGAYKPDRDRDATILGEVQWQWLEALLREPADLRLIVSSIQFVSDEHRWEKWSNFPEERRKMLRLIEDTEAEGIIFLSGDRHHAELSRIPAGEDLYSLYDLTASGLNQSRRPEPGQPRRMSETNRYRVGTMFRGHHFGLLEIDFEALDPVIHLAIIDDRAERVIQETVRLAELDFSSIMRSTAFEQELEPQPSVEKAILLDGDVSDWVGSTVVAADGDRVYLRFAAESPRTLRSSPVTTEIYIDSDASDATGQVIRWRSRGNPPASGNEIRGADLKIAFSAEPEGPSGRRWRPTVETLGESKGSIDAETFGLAAAPSHGSDWFEVSWLQEWMESTIEVVVVEKRDGEETRTLVARDTARLPETAQPNLPVMEIPVKEDGSIRIVAYNLLWASHLEKPEPFGRILRALDADILLFQEWSRNRISHEEVDEWLDAHVGRADYHTSISGVSGYWSGTLLASRWPIRGATNRYTDVDAGGWDFPARFAAGLVDTPAGTVLAGSVHLKAGGYYGSREDARRLAEAVKVNGILQGMEAIGDPRMVVLGGDFNLNGDPAIMERATAYLDWDNSGLAVAPATVLGKPNEFYTHGRSGVRNRLDFLNYGEAEAEATAAFVLDTTLLSDSILEKHGLQREDTLASDHLPVVLDLKPKD